MSRSGRLLTNTLMASVSTIIFLLSFVSSSTPADASRAIRFAATTTIKAKSPTGIVPKSGHWEGSDPAISFNVTENGIIINFSIALTLYAFATCTVWAPSDPAIEANKTFTFNDELDASDQSLGTLMNQVTGKFKTATSASGSMSIHFCTMDQGNVVMFEDAAKGNWTAKWKSPAIISDRQKVHPTPLPTHVPIANDYTPWAVDAVTEPLISPTGLTLERVVMTRSVDSSNCALEVTNTFTTADDTIYVVAVILNLKEDTRLSSSWKGPDLFWGYTNLAGIEAARQCVYFYIDTDGLAPGVFTVFFMADDLQTPPLRFTIEQAQ
ncbi:MAG: hypothetical protein KF716_32010 [Anaerolineae bacterium]|nr:hypothetical protein [Anaerolineae bacterium]